MALKGNLSTHEMDMLAEMHKSGMIEPKEWARILAENTFPTNPPGRVGELIYKDGSQKMAPARYHGDDTMKMSPPLNSPVGGLSSVAAQAQARAMEPFMPPKDELFRLLAGRLRCRPGDHIMPGMEFIDFFVGKEKVFVFVVKNDQPVVLEDEPGLFPSDSLLTAIKLLEG